MKRNILLGSLVLLAGSLIAADSTPKDDLTAAAKALGAKSNYSWTTLVDFGPNAPFTPGPTEGKTEKDGATWLSVSFNDNTTEGLIKGGKVAVKTEEGWKAGDTSGGGGGGGGGFNPAAFMTRRMQNLKTPSAEVEDLVSKTKEIKKDGDTYSGDLTDEGAKALLAGGFGRRGGPPPSDAKGSVKFWVKDGLVSKYESKVTGKRTNQNGDEVPIDRTTTVEIKNVGTTKLEIPAEAKDKLS
jgi:hypothetical protein